MSSIMVNFQYFQSFWDTLKKYLAGFTKLRKELQTVEAKMDFLLIQICLSI